MYKSTTGHYISASKMRGLKQWVPWLLLIEHTAKWCVCPTFFTYAWWCIRVSDHYHQFIPVFHFISLHRIHEGCLECSSDRWLNWVLYGVGHMGTLFREGNLHNKCMWHEEAPRWGYFGFTCRPVTLIWSDGCFFHITHSYVYPPPSNLLLYHPVQSSEIWWWTWLKYSRDECLWRPC